MNAVTAADGSKTERRKRRRGGCLKLVLAVPVLAMGAYAVNWLANIEPQPTPVTITPSGMKAVGTIDERFLSYNVEMVEITGGRFWRPYSDGKRKGDDRYEYRPPLNLNDPKLIRLAAALGPAYMRVSGTWANATYFDAENGKNGKPPKGFDTVLTGDQWRGVAAFAKAADARIVTSFATSAGTRDAKGVWQTDHADRFMTFTRSIGAEIAAAEFANEPETVELTQAPKGYTPADYRRDYTRFHGWLRKASPDTLILAPGAAELGQPIDFLRKWTSGMTIFDPDDLITAKDPRPDAVSFHFYGSASQRCGEIPVIGYAKDDAMSKNWLGLIDKAIVTISTLRDKVAPGAPLWLTETAETACGGNPWAADFADVFRFSDQMARAARQGVQVYMHNTLSASDYGLIDEKTHRPRPNYWAAWLWRNLMGTKVLAAGDGTSGLHLYAHCQKGQPGGVTLLAINRDEADSRTVNLPSDAVLYSLKEGTKPGIALLNGVALEPGVDGALPVLSGAAVKAGPLRLSPASVNYLAFPQAANPACF